MQVSVSVSQPVQVPSFVVTVVSVSLITWSVMDTPNVMSGRTNGTAVSTIVLGLAASEFLQSCYVQGFG